MRVGIVPPLGKLYTYGYMNVDAEPMTFAEVRKLAKQLEIPDFDVMKLDKNKRLAKKYKDPANCIIRIPYEDGDPSVITSLISATRWNIELPG